MEIKKIISMCKKSGQLLLIDNGGDQWISDGFALYPLVNMPPFDEETVCRAYDISESKASKMRIEMRPKIPTGYDISDDVENESPCDYEEPMFGGLVPVQTSQGMMFIKGQYLTPFKGMPEDMIRIFERYSESVGIYFAIKVGFVLSAIVMPYDCINDSLVNRMERVYEQCKLALYNKNGKEENV